MLAQWIKSDILLEASVDMAAINSILQVGENQLVEVNAAEVIARESKNKNLVIVDHFPFVERLKDITNNCWVIEKNLSGRIFPMEVIGKMPFDARCKDMHLLITYPDGLSIHIDAPILKLFGMSV
jgi:hypothetical protein